MQFIPADSRETNNNNFSKYELFIVTHSKFSLIKLIGNAMKYLSLFLILLLPNLAWSADAVYSTKGIAVNGYDVVAYHTDKKAEKGNAKHVYNWNDVDWHFSSKENLNLFKSSPARYAPQYGGFCAYAASKGSLAPTDPHAWTIYNDKLYLNYSKSVRSTWEKDIDQHIKRADKNWLRLKN